MPRRRTSQSEPRDYLVSHPIARCDGGMCRCVGRPSFSRNRCHERAPWTGLDERHAPNSPLLSIPCWRMNDPMRSSRGAQIDVLFCLPGRLISACNRSAQACEASHTRLSCTTRPRRRARRLNSAFTRPGSSHSRDLRSLSTFGCSILP